MAKSHLRFSQASGTDRRRVFESVNHIGRYARRAILRRRAAWERRNFNLHLLTNNR